VLFFKRRAFVWGFVFGECKTQKARIKEKNSWMDDDSDVFGVDSLVFKDKTPPAKKTQETTQRKATIGANKKYFRGFCWLTAVFEKKKKKKKKKKK
jgi:hypothetical protein